MASRALAAIVPFILTALACSSGSGSSSSPSNPGPSARGDTATHTPANDAGAAVATKDVCATLDYGHVRSNADFYLQFADDETAFDYSKDFLTANQMPQGVAVSHDERLVRLVGKVYAGMRTVFPSETEGLETPPRIVTVRDDTVNAFAGFDERPDVNKAPWMFWIHTGTVNASIADAQLEGLFGHELAHLILRNYLPETRAKIRTHYRVVGGKEQGIIGSIAADDPVVRKQTEELRTLGKMVSRDFVADTLPYSPFEESDYQSMLTTLHADQQGSPEPDACTATDNGVARMKAIYQAAASIHDIKLSLTASQKAQLAQLGGTTTAAMKKCYGHVKMSLFELKIRNHTADAPADQVTSFIQKALDPTTEEHKYAYSLLMTNDVEQAVDAKDGTPTIDRFLEVVETLHRRITELETDRSLPLDELRVFDLEEDADDAAVRILRALGEDPLSGAHLYVDQMNDPDACYRTVANGTVPPYGEFIDPHNATCWRWFHVNELSKALARCPTTPLARTTSSAASAAISPADRSPMRLPKRRAIGN